jgi:hypothetical protein
LAISNNQLAKDNIKKMRESLWLFPLFFSENYQKDKVKSFYAISIFFIFSLIQQFNNLTIQQLINLTIQQSNK